MAPSIPTPKGSQSVPSFEVPWIVIDLGRVQQILQFLGVAPLAVMLLLIGDVGPNLRPRSGANRERGVAFLPRKRRFQSLIVHPRSCSLLEFSNEIGQSVSGAQTYQEVDVVPHTADSLRNPLKPANRASEIFVEPASPFRSDPEATLLGREDDVVMQTQKRGSHSGLPLGYPGRGHNGDPVGVADISRWSSASSTTGLQVVLSLTP